MTEIGYILMADDSESDVELARRALGQNKLSTEIVVVHDGSEALDFIYRQGVFSTRRMSDPIVVLLDINMPKVNGLEVLAKLKGDPRFRQIPVVMLTSSSEGSDIDECYRLGANAYVAKPVDFEQFSDAVKTIGKFWALLNQPPHTSRSRL